LINCPHFAGNATKEKLRNSDNVTRTGRLEIRSKQS
jgi:hypothetical protein